MTSLAFRVYGLPAPQGSKKHVGNGRMVEMSKKVKPWRQDVVAAALAAIAADHTFETFTGPVFVEAYFWFPRPKYHFGTGRNANVLKPLAPDYVSAKPDLDKLLRSTFDALSTAGVWRDDNVAVKVTAEKLYVTDGITPGADLVIGDL